MGNDVSKVKVKNKNKKDSKYLNKNDNHNEDINKNKDKFLEQEKKDLNYYLAYNDDSEFDRLHRQHFAIKATLNDRICITLFKENPLHVLDIGYGSATWVFDFATEYNFSIVNGIDINDNDKILIKPPNCNLAKYNVLGGIKFNNEIFDFVHQRLMFAAYKFDDWKYIMKEIYRVTKKGGYVEFGEFDLYPKIKNVDGEYIEIDNLNNKLYNLYHKLVQFSINERKLDILIYKRLEQLMIDTGFKNIRTECIKIPHGVPYNKYIYYDKTESNIGNQWKNVANDLFKISAKENFQKYLKISNDEYDTLINEALNECNNNSYYHEFHFFSGQKIN